VIEMRPYIQFNKGYQYILTVIDVLSTHGPYLSKQKNETEMAIAKIIRDDGRCLKNLQTEKRILQCKRINTLEKTHHKSLFNIFCNEGVSRRTIQSYVEER